MPHNVYLMCEFVEFRYSPFSSFHDMNSGRENQGRVFETNESMSMIIGEGPKLQQITGEHSQALVIVFRNVGRK